MMARCCPLGVSAITAARAFLRFCISWSHWASTLSISCESAIEVFFQLLGLEVLADVLLDGHTCSPSVFTCVLHSGCDHFFQHGFLWFLFSHWPWNRKGVLNSVRISLLPTTLWQLDIYIVMIAIGCGLMFKGLKESVVESSSSQDKPQSPNQYNA